MNNLVILGAGRNLLDLLDVVDALNEAEPTWRIVGILDDGNDRGREYCGYSILGPLAEARKLDHCEFASSIWNERVFRDLHLILGETGLDADNFASLVHPRATVSTRATLGRGVIVNAGASVAGGVDIGDFVSLGPNSTVGHDTRIDSFSTVAAGAVISGSVHIGPNCYIGSGALVRQMTRIGEGVLVGLGAVVVNDIPDRVTVVGNPARSIVKKNLSQSDPDQTWSP